MFIPNFFMKFHYVPETQKVDPKLRRCRCGYTFKFTKIGLLLMFIRKGFVFRCPVCKTVIKFHIVYHVVNEVEKDENKLLSDAERVLWKHC